MRKVIELNFANPETWAINGQEFGKETFHRQVEPVLPENLSDNEVQVVFPDNVVVITYTFWKGFTQEFIKTIGYENIFQKVEFKTSSDKLTRGLLNEIE
ncbi:hypothetical protein H7198_02845 [Fructobacillus sp. CRL 2054]|uniref:hypothetical protein n=1 Tax=Fructobacillus sp. CRL 2054 TaxID=2763007 RepID=UPI002379F654|nr:hypothetical protein [Fructobacillus sp. CRL 2054]MDD9138550.1 hypothetical protein [Fructobacillus sp. CRL 2054]